MPLESRPLWVNHWGKMPLESRPPWVNHWGKMPLESHPPWVNHWGKMPLESRPPWVNHWGEMHLHPPHLTLRSQREKICQHPPPPGVQGRIKEVYCYHHVMPHTLACTTWEGKMASRRGGGEDRLPLTTCLLDPGAKVAPMWHPKEDLTLSTLS